MRENDMHQTLEHLQIKHKQYNYIKLYRMLHILFHVTMASIYCRIS